MFSFDAYIIAAECESHVKSRTLLDDISFKYFYLYCYEILTFYTFHYRIRKVNDREGIA